MIFVLSYIRKQIVEAEKAGSGTDISIPTSRLSWITIWQEVVWRWVFSLLGPIVQVSKHFSATEFKFCSRKKNTLLVFRVTV